MGGFRPAGVSRKVRTELSSASFCRLSDRALGQGNVKRSGARGRGGRGMGWRLRSVMDGFSLIRREDRGIIREELYSANAPALRSKSVDRFNCNLGGVSSGLVGHIFLGMCSWSGHPPVVRSGLVS